MTKIKVLEIFRNSEIPLTPDNVRRKLFGFHKRCSVYSYLLRLHKQGFLYRTFVGNRIAYRISERGIARLNYLEEKENQR